MSHPEGPHAAHELDQLLAAFRQDDIGIPHVVGTLSILETLLEELPKPPEIPGVVPVIRLDQIRTGIEQRRDSFLQILAALKETP